MISVSKCLATTFALLLTAVPARAGLLISPFTSDQEAMVVGGSGPQSAFTEPASPQSLGGFRDIIVNRTGATGGGIVFAESNVTDPGFFTLTLGPGVLGSAELQFDGMDNSDSINPTGLGGIDITQLGANDGFLLRMAADSAAPLIVTAYTDAGNFSRASVAIPISPTFTLTEVFLPFSSFATLAGSGVDFSNVGALSFLVDGTASPGLDVKIDYIEATSLTSSPEPSSLVMSGLFALGILGYCLARRASKPAAVTEI